MTNRTPRILLIGGAPLTGKSRVARSLGREHGLLHISTDDIGLAARAVTTPHSHPQLHATAKRDYVDYYAGHTTQELLADAHAAHRALWPAIRSVVAAHLEWAAPAVVEGWALLPEFVTPILGSQVAAVWLCASRSLLSRRIKEDGFLARNERAFESYLDRSAAFDQQLRGSVPSHLLIEVLDGVTVEELAGKCWVVANNVRRA